MRLTLLILTTLTTAIALPALADPEIKVLETDGQAVDTHGVTTLVFRGEPGTRVHQVLAAGSAYGSTGLGTMVSSYGETTRFLCAAPCTLEVPNGTYDLRASDNLLFGGRFTVVANGAPQTWAVEDASSGLGVLGILGTGFGLGGVIGGAMLAAFDEESLGGTPTALALTAGSAGLTAIGLWALINAFGDAERVEP
jgi:hypothetical protein